jgi:hypothetical protein
MASFRIAAASAAAMGQTAVLQLNLRTAEGYESSTSFSVMVGVADHTNPLGPDAYGYYAYDNSDTDYPDSAPLYEWIECSTVYGGSGTKLTLRDNTNAKVDLPFPFTYYGESYDKILVSDNGWVSFDLSYYYDFYNWHMPNSYGNGAQIAPFWDNLDPTRKIDNVPIADGVYVLNDTERNIFVVEWSRMPNVRPEIDNLQTFELILYDPAHYPTRSGDGIIQFQYKQIVNDDDARMYATVGIENMNEDVGIEYTYSNLYSIAAAPVSAGLAIRFSTDVPRYNPVTLASFMAAPTGQGVLLTWEPVPMACSHPARSTRLPGPSWTRAPRPIRRTPTRSAPSIPSGGRRCSAPSRIREERPAARGFSWRRARRIRSRSMSRSHSDCREAASSPFRSMTWPDGSSARSREGGRMRARGRHRGMVAMGWDARCRAGSISARCARDPTGGR